MKEEIRRAIAILRQRASTVLWPRPFIAMNAAGIVTWPRDMITIPERIFLAVAEAFTIMEQTRTSPSV
jgi:hypothetical protein